MFVNTEPFASFFWLIKLGFFYIAEYLKS